MDVFELHQALGKARGEALFEKSRADCMSSLLRIQREKALELKRLLRVQSKALRAALESK